MKKEENPERGDIDNFMLNAQKVMASTLGGQSESTVYQGEKSEPRQKLPHGETKSVFSRKHRGEQHQTEPEKRDEKDDICQIDEEDNKNLSNELENNNARLTQSADKPKRTLKIWNLLVNRNTFDNAEVEKEYILQQLEGTSQSFMCLQICFASIFFILFVINMREQHFSESSTDDSLGESITQIFIGVIDLLVLGFSQKWKNSFIWRLNIVSWQLIQSVYLEQVLFNNLNQIIYDQIGNNECQSDKGNNTFELKYQLLKGLSIILIEFFLLRNISAWNYRMVLSVILVTAYSVILFQHCSFWLYITTLITLTLLFLFYFYQEELKSRKSFKSKISEQPQTKQDSNSPSLYNMVHEQISSGLIVVQRSSLLQSSQLSDLNLKFANKISIKQLNCTNEQEILARFKEIFVPVVGLNNSPNPQQTQRSSNSLYDMLMNYLDQIAKNPKKDISFSNSNNPKDPSNISPKKSIFNSINSIKPQLLDHPQKRRLLTIRKTSSLVQISQPESNVRIRLNSLGMQSQNNKRRSFQQQISPFYPKNNNIQKGKTNSDNSSQPHQLPALNLSAIQEHHSFKPSTDSIMTPSSSKLNLDLKQKSTSDKQKQRNSFTDGKLIYGVLKSVQRCASSEQKTNRNETTKQFQPYFDDGSGILPQKNKENIEEELQQQQSGRIDQQDGLLNTPSMLQVQLTNSEKLFRQFDFKINQIEWDNQPALIILVTDSTQQLINEKLKELEMYKEELLYTMQHISRTPLNSIINISEILLSQYFKQYQQTNNSNRLLEENNNNNNHLNIRQTQLDQLEDIMQSLHIIKNNGYILLHTINTVTDLSEFQTNQGNLDIDAQPFSLQEVLDEIKDLYLHQIQEKKLEYSVTIATSSGHVNSDKKRVTQLLFEIIGNAIKYTKSGFVHVKVKEQEKGLFWVKVQDSGEGMSEEHKKNLFSNSLIQYCQRERDFSKKTSAGLGLDFSRKIVGILGPFYQIFIKSTQGQGSSFKFLLYSDFDSKSTIDIASLRNRILMLQKQSADQGGGIFTPEQVEKMAATYNNGKISRQSSKYQNNNLNLTQNQISTKIIGTNSDDQQYFKKIAVPINIQQQVITGTSTFGQYPCENYGDDTLEVGVESNSNCYLNVNNNGNNSGNSRRPSTQLQPQQISEVLGKKDNNLFQSEIKDDKSNISLLKHSTNLQMQKYTSLDYDNTQRYMFPQSANFNNRRSQFEIDLGNSTILNYSIQKPLNPRKKSKQIQMQGQLSNISSHILNHISPSEKNIPFIEITEEIRAKYHTGTYEIKQGSCFLGDSQHKSQVSSHSNLVNDNSVGSKYSPIQLAQYEITCKPKNDQNGLPDILFTTPNGMVDCDSIENMMQKHQKHEITQNNYFSKSPYLSACSTNKTGKKSKINDLPFSQHKWHCQSHPRAELNKLKNRNDLTDEEADNFSSTGDTPKDQRNNSEYWKNKKAPPPPSPYKRERKQQRTSTQIVQSLKIDDFEGRLWKVFAEKCYVLGIDDNIFNLNILEMVFKKCSNIIFHKAGNGQECLDKAVSLKQEQNESYKIYLMDIQMPIMDGYKAHEELKILMKNNTISQAPVFAVTAYANEKAICLQQGMEGFIEKPINMKILVSLIYDYFFNQEDLKMQQKHYLNQYSQTHQE